MKRKSLIKKFKAFVKNVRKDGKTPTYEEYLKRREAYKSAQYDEETWAWLLYDITFPVANPEQLKDCLICETGNKHYAEDEVEHEKEHAAIAKRFPKVKIYTVYSIKVFKDYVIPCVWHRRETIDLLKAICEQDLEEIKERVFFTEENMLTNEQSDKLDEFIVVNRDKVSRLSESDKIDFGEE